MTALAPINDPYATLRVAVYEAFVSTWTSLPGIEEVLTSVVQRAVSARHRDVPGGASAPSPARFEWHAADATPVVAPSSTDEPVIAEVAAAARALHLPPEEAKHRAEVIRGLRLADQLTVEELLDALDRAHMPHLLRLPGLKSVLSPIGVAHLYRQLYFDAGAGVGPIEHAFTLAPLEQMEVVQVPTRACDDRR